MKKKIFRYILVALVVGVIACVTIYEANFFQKPDLSNVNFATCVDNHHRTIGDYVVICEENGIHTFPFITGGSLSLLSIPEGKKYGVVDDKSFLKGFGNPIIADGYLYYDETWDGSEQGSLYRFEPDKRDEVYLQHVYNEPFYIMQNCVYYLEEDTHYLKILDTRTLESKTLIEEAISSFILDENNVYYYVKNRGLLCKFNLEKSVKEDLTWEVGSYDVLDIIVDQSANIFLQTGKDGIIMCDTTSNEIKKVVDNGDIKDKIVYYMTALMYLEGQNLYYLDDAWNIFCKNIDSGKTRRLLNASEINFFRLSEEDFIDSNIIMSCCDNYIVFQISALTEEEEWKCGIIAFDYEGNEVYRNDRMRLNL